MPSHHPCSTPKKRGDGEVSPLLLDPSQRGLAAPLRGPYKSPSHRPCTSTRIMLFVVPVTVFSLAFFWVAILIHTQVPDHGTQGLQPRLPRRIFRRVVGAARKHLHGPGLGLRMPPESYVQTSGASVDRPPRGRQEATIVRIRLHHLCPKSRDVPAKPGRPQRYCTVLVRTVTRRTSQYPRPLPRYPPQHRGPRRGTTPHPGRVPKSPVNALSPPPSTTTASSDRLFKPCRDAHTRRVGHTFPLVNLGLSE